MADKDPEENLSLQLPSFGFGRKKSKDEPVDADPVEPEASHPVEPEASQPAEPEPEASQPAEPEPEVSQPVEPAPPPAVDPAPSAKPARKPKPAAATPKPARTPKPAATTPKPARAPKPAATAKPEVPAPPVTPVPVAPELDAKPSEPAPAPAPIQAPVERVEPSVRPAAGSTVTQTQQLPVDSGARRGPSFPVIPALQAVLAVGALVGILGVLLTFASLKFCELVSGTDSCGGPGLLLLLATLVVLTYVGAWLLRGFGIDDPGSTSFLAVALLAVMTMVFFLGDIYSWWMILVIPPVSMAMYALSWWVTGFVDTDDSPT
ncbi:hypothetical protein [Nocardioides sp.]|uniref:hypothetical protein n=1 Tax=Nocardioides sp. TaxID=35761 RepID=UPI002C848E26|nr:hypothetical protein [Nocardioides sp.]HXH80070.1 hypothetical protein [Nocardioides sp.]